ncbi:MAG: PAS domain S-box protein [candidate division WOR-3 bacterium]|nr:MAG: PAS domain S-box protein [candidate division WOR-3 bacterium]
MKEEKTSSERISRRPLSIRGKMVLSFSILFALTFIIANLIAMFGIPFSSFRGTYRLERDQALRDLDFIAGLKHERLEMWIKERKANLQMITHCEKIIGSVKGLKQTMVEKNLRPDKPTFKSDMQRENHYSILRRELQMMQDMYGEYNTLCIIDPGLGICIVSTDTTRVGRRVYHKRFIREALETGHGEAVDLELHPASRKPSLAFTRLIADAAENPVGILVAHVDADAFVKPMLYVGEEIGKTEEVMILDESARPLVQLKHPLADGSRADMLIDSIMTEDAKLAMNGESGVMRTKDYRGVHVMAAYRFVPITPYRGIGLIVKRDESEITMSILTRMGYSLAVALCGLLVALVLTSWNATRISEPIIKLSNTARAVEAGDLTARASATTGDEVGTLAAVFNSMLNQIQQWHVELEKEVEVRSKALRKINEELEFRIAKHKSTEIALRESKNFTERLINLMKDGFSVIDPNGVHLSVNAALCQMTGFTEDELIGIGLPHPYWPEEEIDRIMETFQKTLAGEFDDFELIFKRKNGERFPVLVSPSCTEDAQGNVKVYFATHKDISERKRALEALQQSEEKYRMHFENASDVIYSIDRNLRILSVSPSVERILGYKVKDLVGKNIAKLNLIAPEYLDSVSYDIGRILQGEQIPSSVYEFLTKGGSRKFGEVSGAPLYRNRKIVGIVSVARDITERKNAEEEVRKVNRALRILSNCNMALVRTTDEKDLLKGICKLIVEIGGYPLAWVGYAQNDDHRTIKCVAQAGSKSKYANHFKATWGDKRTGRNPFGIAIRTGKYYLCREIDKDMNCAANRAASIKAGCKSLIALPMMNKDTVLGVLSIHATEANAFDEREIALLQELAEDLSYGIQALRAHIARQAASEELERSYVKLRTTLEETVNALASATEKRDPYTAGHQRRVTQLACAIAKEMKMSEESIEGIRIAGLLHDIGKISVPAEILSKPGRLSESEFSIIKLHSEIGYDILKTINFPWPVAQITLQHHERINGSGYPRGLSGDEILIEAKILAVADVVEAMSSHRPYRPARTMKETVEEISRNQDGLYDSHVAEVCLRLFTKRRFKFTKV